MVFAYYTIEPIKKDILVWPVNRAPMLADANIITISRDQSMLLEQFGLGIAMIYVPWEVVQIVSGI